MLIPQAEFKALLKLGLNLRTVTAAPAALISGEFNPGASHWQEYVLDVVRGCPRLRHFNLDSGRDQAHWEISRTKDGETTVSLSKLTSWNSYW